MGLSGWDQAKYEEYSTFYDNTTFGYYSRTISAEQTMFKIDMKLQEMPQNTEFEKTWYLVFYNYYKGIDTKTKAPVYQSYEFLKPEDREYRRQSAIYFEKSREYLQKIEEMKPN